MGGMLQLKETEVFKIVKLKAKGRQTALQLIAHPPPPKTYRAKISHFLRHDRLLLKSMTKKKNIPYYSGK